MNSKKNIYLFSPLLLVSATMEGSGPKLRQERQIQLTKGNNKLYQKGT